MKQKKAKARLHLKAKTRPHLESINLEGGKEFRGKKKSALASVKLD